MVNKRINNKRKINKNIYPGDLYYSKDRELVFSNC